MKSFGFTRKKYSSLTDQGRHRHVMNWLLSVFQTLRTGRVSKARWMAFAGEYETLLSWTKDTLHAPLPGDTAVPARLAWLSDAIHRHRSAAGMVIRDHDLSKTIIVGDRIRPAAARPDMEYQVALDGLRSLFNIGSVFRICEAAGVETLILGNCPGKEDPRVKKTAMGAQERIRQEKTEDLAGLLTGKKRQGFTVIGVDTVKGSTPCQAFQWPQKAVLVFGNEEYGLAPHLLPAADRFVHIPMFGAKNSMNVANAVSIVLFQAVFAFTSQWKC